MSIFFLVVQYIQRVLEFSPLRAGLAFLLMTLGIFVMSRITPRLLARFGRIPLLLVGTLGLTASYLGFPCGFRRTRHRSRQDYRPCAERRCLQRR
ncbi:hypothetical protein [Streptomyces sp. NPDC001675]